MTLIRPILKRVHSPDVADLACLSSDDRTHFGFLLEAMFGPEDGDGEESFGIVVCTPSWIAAKVDGEGIMSGRHHLVVREFNLKQITAFLADYAEK